MTLAKLSRSRHLMASNVLTLYTQASEGARYDGLSWYPAARRIMREWSSHYGYSVDTCACVTAALSPQVEWTRNLIMADDMLAHRALSIGGALQANITKALRIRDEQTTVAGLYAIFPQGPKVNCFAANLAGDDSVVTIDGHAFQACMNDPSLSFGFRWNHYAEISKVYVDVAHDLGIAPTALQAVTWCAWRERWPRETKKAHIRARSTTYGRYR